jgi:hypothetical protein
MPNQDDIADRKLTTRLFLIIAGAVVVLAALVFFFVGPMIVESTAAGLDLKESAVIAFGLTIVALIVMAIAAGDGLIGEFQFMVAAFAGFFVVSWLMIAWIF